MTGTNRSADTDRENEPMTMNNGNNYDDIIDMPHHVSKRHPPLDRDSYAAQFSPFAALTGYDGIVAESARATNSRIELDDEAKERISGKLSFILSHPEGEKTVSITYFVPDRKKEGGEYVTASGTVASFDELTRIIRMSDGTEVELDEVTDFRILRRKGENNEQDFND